MKALKALVKKLLTPAIIVLMAALWMYVIVDTQDSTGLMCWLFTLAAGLSASPAPLKSPVTEMLSQAY